MASNKEQAKIGGGIEVSWGAGHRDKNGKLICQQLKRGRWFNYFLGNWDTKRAVWCEAHRYDEAPEDFRTGKLSLASIRFTIKLMREKEWNEL